VSTLPSDPEPSPVPWRAAFAYRDFNCFQGARTCVMLGVQMQSVAVGWQIYAATGRPLDLAWVGLAQFLPAAGLSLVTGHTADRFDRRAILMSCQAALAALALGLFVTTRLGSAIGFIYVVLVGIGVARAFIGPATQSMLPTLVPVEHFGNAVAWSASFFQVATVVGPMLGGVLYAAAGGAAAVYAVAGACMLAALALVAAMRKTPPGAPRAATNRASLLAGVRYVRGNPIVLGAISLDLFAVLLGGATALLPIYARDILKLGPWALGALRSAPAAGAAVVAVALARWPLKRRAGLKMLFCVAIFGAGTIVFGLSRSFALSLAALVITGAADMVSVFVRSTLVQLATPEPMRGRVSAVNMVFIGASNELGEFESGVMAQWLGAVPSVVVGGVGTLLVVALWAWRFPRLAGVDRLEDVHGEPEPPPLALEPLDPRP
jgi:MFS family permease